MGKKWKRIEMEEKQRNTEEMKNVRKGKLKSKERKKNEGRRKG